MRWSWFVALLAAGLAVSLAGCSGSSDSSGSGGGTATARKRPPLAPGESLITYSKVGGPPNAFIDVTLKIEEDGSFTLEQYKKPTITGKLTEAELATLETVFTDNDFEHADSDLSRSDTNIDQLNYDIRYAGHSVTILHGAIPPKVKPIVETCDAFVASHAG
jgi:hypothetical protein